MTDILDRVGESSGHFRPGSITDFFALQLARKLGDVERLHNYLSLTEQHPQPWLLQAFRTAAKRPDGPGTLAERFEAELRRLINKKQRHE
jgi:hypothetical protein